MEPAERAGVSGAAGQPAGTAGDGRRRGCARLGPGGPLLRLLNGPFSRRDALHHLELPHGEGTALLVKPRPFPLPGLPVGDRQLLQGEDAEVQLDPVAFEAGQERRARVGAWCATAPRSSSRSSSTTPLPRSTFIAAQLAARTVIVLAPRPCSWRSPRTSPSASPSRRAALLWLLGLTALGAAHARWARGSRWPASSRSRATSQDVISSITGAGGAPLGDLLLRPTSSPGRCRQSPRRSPRRSSSA